MSSIAIHPGLTRSGAARPASRRRVAASPPPAEVRLTRRGRVLALLLLVGLLLVVSTLFGSRSAATGERGAPVETRSVVVGSGDTLWGIAADVADPGETREMVYQIRQLNALTGSGLRVGQQIAVPVD